MDKERLKELNILSAPLAMAKIHLMQQVFEPNDELPLTYSYLSHLYDAYDELLRLAGLKKKDATEPSNTELDTRGKKTTVDLDGFVIVDFDKVDVVSIQEQVDYPRNNKPIHTLTIAFRKLEETDNDK